MEGRSWGDGCWVCSLRGEKKEKKTWGADPKKGRAMWVSFFGKERVGELEEGEQREESRMGRENGGKMEGKMGGKEKRIKIKNKIKKREILMVAGGVGRERMSGQVKVGGGEKRKREEREKIK